ncbi:MAG: hypothetical protein ABEI96_00870 [Haloarculaceae archaeon]
MRRIGGDYDGEEKNQPAAFMGRPVAVTDMLALQTAVRPGLINLAGAILGVGGIALVFAWLRALYR